MGDHRLVTIEWNCFKKNERHNEFLLFLRVHLPGIYMVTCICIVKILDNRTVAICPFLYDFFPMFLCIIKVLPAQAMVGLVLITNGFSVVHLKVVELH